MLLRESFSLLQNLISDPKPAKDGGRFSIDLGGLWIRSQESLGITEGLFL